MDPEGLSWSGSSRLSLSRTFRYRGRNVDGDLVKTGNRRLNMHRHSHFLKCLGNGTVILYTTCIVIYLEALALGRYCALYCQKHQHPNSIQEECIRK